MKSSAARFLTLTTCMSVKALRNVGLVFIKPHAATATVDTFVREHLAAAGVKVVDSGIKQRMIMLDEKDFPLRRTATIGLSSWKRTCSADCSTRLSHCWCGRPCRQRLRPISPRTDASSAYSGRSQMMQKWLPSVKRPPPSYW